MGVYTCAGVCVRVHQYVDVCTAAHLAGRNENFPSVTEKNECFPSVTGENEYFPSVTEGNECISKGIVTRCVTLCHAEPL